MLLQKTCAIAARPHSMLILKVYMQKFETGGFVDPGIKSRFQTEAWEKKICSTCICFCFTDKWMHLACVMVLSCLSSEPASTSFLGNCNFKTQSQGRQLRSCISSSTLSFTEFWALGLAFEQKFCDGGCRVWMATWKMWTSTRVWTLVYRKQPDDFNLQSTIRTFRLKTQHGKT